MADTQSPSPTPDDMHWGISYLREDLQDLRQESRDFRREVNAEFANVRGEMGDFRKRWPPSSAICARRWANISGTPSWQSSA